MMMMMMMTRYSADILFIGMWCAGELQSGCWERVATETTS
jgi:hypothetical protein